MSRYNLEGKVALVTGAASGIGEGCARWLAQAGAAVGIADLNLAGAQQVAASIAAEGGRALGVAMDVANEDAVNAGIQHTVDVFGSIDILVSNAGIQIVHPIEEFTFNEWRRVQSIHLDGAFLTTQAAIRHMYSSGRGGAIIYTGSVHSHLASKLKSAYVAAKHGLLGLARTVAKEGAQRGVRAYVVCPGFVRTPLVDKQIPEQAKTLGLSEEEVIRQVMLKDTVDGQFTTIDEVAEVVTFLASFPGNALTGQSFVVSHGWFMQ
ncbi:3-hydroxybutyrate dehydrogenase [Chitinimonas lacunae]|uniref:3-hydroxybutyrate dehydrogenase n=1 Tax=Chitinimonas lacunae TaxID=1963018 RepID=A0ABV8MVM5_9NEIS